MRACARASGPHPPASLSHLGCSPLPGGPAGSRSQYVAFLGRECSQDAPSLPPFVPPPSPDGPSLAGIRDGRRRHLLYPRASRCVYRAHHSGRSDDGHTGAQVVKRGALGGVREPPAAAAPPVERTVAPGQRRDHHVCTYVRSPYQQRS